MARDSIEREKRQLLGRVKAEDIVSCDLLLAITLLDDFKSVPRTGCLALEDCFRNLRDGLVTFGLPVLFFDVRQDML